MPADRDEGQAILDHRSKSKAKNIVIVAELPREPARRDRLGSLFGKKVQVSERQYHRLKLIYPINLPALRDPTAIKSYGAIVFRFSLAGVWPFEVKLDDRTVIGREGTLNSHENSPSYNVLETSPLLPLVDPTRCSDTKAFQSVPVVPRTVPSSLLVTSKFRGHNT